MRGCAITAPALDVIGRVLAPSVLTNVPVAILTISPADPHLLLAPIPLAGAVAIVFFARVARGWAIYSACTDGLLLRISDGREGLLARLRPRAGSRSRTMLVVLLLPDMPGAVLAARALLRPRDYGLALAASTGGGLAVTLLVATRFDRQIDAVGEFVAAHPAGSTLIVVGLVVLGWALRHSPRPLRGQRRVCPSSSSRTISGR